MDNLIISRESQTRGPREVLMRPANVRKNEDFERILRHLFF